MGQRFWRCNERGDELLELGAIGERRKAKRKEPTRARRSANGGTKNRPGCRRPGRGARCPGRHFRTATLTWLKTLFHRNGKRHGKKTKECRRGESQATWRHGKTAVAGRRLAC